MTYSCKEKKICANYSPESLRCCFFYDWCKIRKDIENARINLIMKERAVRIEKLAGWQNNRYVSHPQDITGKLNDDGEIEREPFGVDV